MILGRYMDYLAALWLRMLGCLCAGQHRGSPLKPVLCPIWRIPLPPSKRLYKTREVADLFEVSPETVIEWVRTRKLRALRTPGGRDYRFRAAEVEELLHTDLVPAPPTNENGPAGAANTGQAL